MGVTLSGKQCSGSMGFFVWWIRIRIRGSMPLTNGSGCGSGSCYFRHWPSRGQQKTNFFYKVFLLITFWRYIYIIFQKEKVQKKSQNSRDQGFSYYFCLMIEGSGSGSPKDMWIQWIRIQNTVGKVTGFFFSRGKFEMSFEHPCSISYSVWNIPTQLYYLLSNPKICGGFIGRMDYLTYWISTLEKLVDSFYTRKHQQNMP